MPKKFKGENSKATVARAAKAAKVTAERDRVDKEKEDESWRDDDKQIAKKAARKDDKETKRVQEVARKLELKALADAEMEAAGGSSSKVASAAPKVTRHQLDKEKDRQTAVRVEEEAKDKLAKKNIVVVDEQLADNVNRVTLGEGSARTVTDALDVFKDDSIAAKADNVDRHAEKRQKATYAAFEETWLPQLKVENPTSRMSQLKQMLKKEWQKSPINPINARIMAVNEVQAKMGEGEEDGD